MTKETALLLLNDGEITHSQYLSIIVRYRNNNVRPDPKTISLYDYETRLSAVKLGYELCHTGKHNSLIQSATEIAKSRGVKPGAYIDRVRNIIWLLTGGETGRNNDKWGVSWTKPMLEDFLKDK